MNMKNILLFLGGLAVGGAAGVLTTKKYFQNKYRQQYEADHNALEEYYHRIDEYTRRPDQNEEDLDDDGINSPNETDSRPGGRMTPEERAEIRDRLNKNWEGTTNYAAMYREKNGYTDHQLAESQHPLDQGEDGEEDPEDDFEETSPEEEAFEEHQKNKNRSPKIISADDYTNLPAHIDKEVLYFYAYDEVLCDDNEEPIEEPERVVGDALTKYGFVDSDERIIFVMNYAMDTCYEIQKLDASWSNYL